MSGKKVLITGMSGLIGGVLQKQLQGSHQLSALNRSDVPGVTCHRGDIADLESIKPAFEGVDVVVHLAAAVGPEITWDQHLPSNIVGTYNVFEAARMAGVKRIIFASTGWVTDSGVVVTDHETGYPYNLIAEGRFDEVKKPWPMITHESPLRPVNLYGCTKIWGEALGRYYSDAFDMSVIVVRIGAVTKEDKPKFMRQKAIWSSHRDIAQLLQKCVEAPDSLRWDIFFGVSNNTWGFRDFSHAQQILGYQPLDNSEQYKDSEIS